MPYGARFMKLCKKIQLGRLFVICFDYLVSKLHEKNVVNLFLDTQQDEDLKELSDIAFQVSFQLQALIVISFSI